MRPCKTHACSAMGWTAAGLAYLGVEDVDVRCLEVGAEADADTDVQSEPNDDTDSLRAIRGRETSVSSASHPSEYES